MRTYRDILLDVDGTLLDFGAAEQVGIAAVLARYGFEADEERIRLYHRINGAAWAAFERGEVTKERLVEERFETFFQELGKNVNGREAEDLYRSYLGQSAVLIDGAEDICRYLKERGYGLYVVTNGTSTTQYKRLALSGLDAYMDGIFVSEDAGSQKPQKEYFDYCFARIPQADPSRMLLVGDSLTSDIKGGINAGVSTCWYNPAGLPEREDIRPDRQIRRLEELKELL